VRVRPAVSTGVERRLSDDEFIVSKTDDKGLITYVNRVFTRISGYDEANLLGQPHNIIRHPDMPRGVFKLLWDTIASGQEIFAYVKNLCREGDHYWVFAHVTPSFDASGKPVAYHSNRRAPSRSALRQIEPIYKLVLAEEAKHSNPKQATMAGFQFVVDFLGQNNTSYEEFVFSLGKETVQ